MGDKGPAVRRSTSQLNRPRTPASSAWNSCALGLSKAGVAGMMDVLSNNSDLAFTPDALRRLAVPQGVREAPSEPAKFQIHRLSARLGAEQIDDVMQRYQAGESARALATEFRTAPSALLRLLRDQNVVVRQQAVTPQQEQQMAQEYESGMTMAELETKHRLSHGAILRALHRSGAVMRAKAPRKKSVSTAVVKLLGLHEQFAVEELASAIRINQLEGRRRRLLPFRSIIQYGQIATKGLLAMPSLTIAPIFIPVELGTCRCVCPGCKSGRHCNERANNCGNVS